MSQIRARHLWPSREPDNVESSPLHPSAGVVNRTPQTSRTPRENGLDGRRIHTRSNSISGRQESVHNSADGHGSLSMSGQSPTSRLNDGFPRDDDSERGNDRQIHLGAANVTDRPLGRFLLPWDQRSTFPRKGFTSDLCGVCVAPKFWEKMDWTIRASILTIVPAAILTLHPSLTTKFALPGLVMDMSLWLTAPTLGEGLKELYGAMKAFTFATLAMAVIVYLQPKEIAIWIILMFSTVVLVSIVADSLKKSTAFCIAVLMLAYLSNDPVVDYTYLYNFYLDMYIGFGIALPAFAIPKVNFALERAKKYCGILGNALSISLQGICVSFWTSSPLQRELNVVRLRLLRQTIVHALKEVDANMGLAAYEPHGGLSIAKVEARRTLLKTILSVVRSSSLLIEVITSSPEVIESPTCMMIGGRIGEALALLASAIDTILLKIVDFNHTISLKDINQFRAARRQFDTELGMAREVLMLSNESFEPDTSDIFLGFFLFSLDEVCRALESFEEPTSAPSVIASWLRSPFEWVVSGVNSTTYVVKSLKRGHIPRRVKEGIKLGGSMTVAAIVQFYSGSPDPVSGAPVIPWVYQRTGADSFNYALMRMLGTVFGSVLSFIGAELANGNVYYIFVSMGVLSLVGAFIQTSKTFSIMGNAMLWSIISISSQFSSRAAAARRIKQNVFAIVVYFFTTSLLWPTRATSRIVWELDASLRELREATVEILHGIDDVNFTDVIARSSVHIKQFKKHIENQESYLKSAIKEPTMVGAPFPEEQWKKVIRSLTNLSSTLSMMKYAFFTFRSSAEDNSVHWYIVSAITDSAKGIADFIFGTVDLYIMMIGQVTIVPTSHLVRLRVGLITALESLQSKFCESYLYYLTNSETLAKEKPKLGAPIQQSEAQEPSSVPHTPKSAASGSQSSNKAKVLTNEDIHSVEAFLFGIRAIVSEIGELEKSILEMKHAQEINLRL